VIVFTVKAKFGSPKPQSQSVPPPTTQVAMKK
jgi:hypothetical protein